MECTSRYRRACKEYLLGSYHIQYSVHYSFMYGDCLLKQSVKEVGDIPTWYVVTSSSSHLLPKYVSVPSLIWELHKGFI